MTLTHARRSDHKNNYPSSDPSVFDRLPLSSPGEAEVVVGNLSLFVHSISSDLTQLLIRLPESVKARASE